MFPEGAAIGQSVEERQRTVAELQAVFEATGFPFFILPLEQVCVELLLLMRLKLITERLLNIHDVL